MEYSQLGINSHELFYDTFIYNSLSRLLPSTEVHKGMANILYRQVNLFIIPVDCRRHKTSNGYMLLNEYSRLTPFQLLTCAVSVLWSQVYHPMQRMCARAGYQDRNSKCQTHFSLSSSPITLSLLIIWKLKVFLLVISTPLSQVPSSSLSASLTSQTNTKSRESKTITCYRELHV